MKKVIKATHFDASISSAVLVTITVLQGVAQGACIQATFPTASGEKVVVPSIQSVK